MPGVIGTSGAVTRVLVASRQQLCRDVLAAALSQHGLEVVARVHSDAVASLVPIEDAGIVVFDTHDSEPTRVAQMIIEIRRVQHELPVLALVDGEDDSMLFTSLDAGATAVVHRGQSLADLVYAIHSAVARQSVLHPSLADKLLSRMRSSGSPARHDRGRLSNREVAVLGGVARGMTNEQIARETSVSPSTVKNQLYSACRKLGVSSRSHAVAEAIRRGIIAPSGDPISAR